MRRPEKRITEFSEIEDVIHQSIVCRLAFSDNDIPYIVPMCFGFHKRTLYFHSAPEGEKIEILKKKINALGGEVNLPAVMRPVEKN